MLVECLPCLLVYISKYIYIRSTLPSLRMSKNRVDGSGSVSIMRCVEYQPIKLILKNADIVLVKNNEENVRVLKNVQSGPFLQ